ncbi:hypothetical protein AB0I94_41220 [Streptomyces sp. NPDC050147]
MAEVRAWAREQDVDVPPRGRLLGEIWDAWYAVHPTTSGQDSTLST